MTEMARDFIERRDSGFYIAGSRVLIDRIITEYRNGEDAETIRAHYPMLDLERVNQAIVFYHDYPEEVERVMEERRLLEDDCTAAHSNPPDIKQKFERMRRQVTGGSSWCECSCGRCGATAES